MWGVDHRAIEQLNSLKSWTVQSKHTEVLCCSGELFVFPQLASGTSHRTHQREPCFPAGMLYGAEGRGGRGLIVIMQAWWSTSPSSSSSSEAFWARIEQTPVGATAICPLCSEHTQILVPTESTSANQTSFLIWVSVTLFLPIQGGRVDFRTRPSMKVQIKLILTSNAPFC